MGFPHSPLSLLDHLKINRFKKTLNKYFYLENFSKEKDNILRKISIKNKILYFFIENLSLIKASSLSWKNFKMESKNKKRYTVDACFN
jgi:hypothetical protein